MKRTRASERNEHVKLGVGARRQTIRHFDKEMAQLTVLYVEFKCRVGGGESQLAGLLNMKEKAIALWIIQMLDFFFYVFKKIVS